MLDSLELRDKLGQLQPGRQPRDPKQFVQDLLQTILPQFEKDLRQLQNDLDTAPPPPAPSGPMAHPVATPTEAILSGEEKYTDIRAPILAVYAVPHDRGAAFKGDAAARAKAEARDEERTGAQAKAFETGIPSAPVIRLPYANGLNRHINNREANG